MIKVLKHLGIIEIDNPAKPGQKTQARKVVFIEEGRGGADQGMNATNEFLSQVTGTKVGLTQVRTHTHPIPLDQMEYFAVGTEFPGYINRELYSTAQLRAQVGVAARNLQGKSTFFKTTIGSEPLPDQDFRFKTVDANAEFAPETLANSRIGVANVKVIEADPVDAPANRETGGQPTVNETAQAVQHEDLTER